MSSAELKKNLVDQLAELNNSTDEHDKMRVAINLKIALATVKRYMAGEVRRFELAEDIISEAKKVLEAKVKA